MILTQAEEEAEGEKENRRGLREGQPVKRKRGGRTSDKIMEDTHRRALEGQAVQCTFFLFTKYHNGQR